MKITVIRYSPHKSENGKLLGFADIAFDGLFVVKGVRLLDGERGKFIAMPSKPRTNKPGQYDDIVYFTKDGAALKEKVLNAILDSVEDAEETIPRGKSKLDI